MSVFTASHLKILVGLLYDTSKYYNLDEFVELMAKLCERSVNSIGVSLEKLQSIPDATELKKQLPDVADFIQDNMETNDELVVGFIDALFSKQFAQLGASLERDDIKELKLPKGPINVLQLNLKNTIKRLKVIVDKKIKESEIVRAKLLGDETTKVKVKKNEKKPIKEMAEKQKVKEKYVEHPKPSKLKAKKVRGTAVVDHCKNVEEQKQELVGVEGHSKVEEQKTVPVDEIMVVSTEDKKAEHAHKVEEQKPIEEFVEKKVEPTLPHLTYDSISACCSEFISKEACSKCLKMQLVNYIKNENKLLREDIKNDFKLFSEDIKNENKLLREEMKVLHEDIKNDIKLLREEMKLFHEDIKNENKLVRGLVEQVLEQMSQK